MKEDTLYKNKNIFYLKNRIYVVQLFVINNFQNKFSNKFGNKKVFNLIHLLVELPIYNSSFFFNVELC